MSEALRRSWWLIERRRFDQAEEEARKHLAQQPDDARGIAMLAWCEVGKNHWQAGEKRARQALEQDPALVFALRALIVCLFYQGGYDKAQKAIDSGLQLEPGAAFYHLYRAMILQKQKKVKKALLETETGLSKEPRQGKLLQLRAELLWSSGKGQKAREAILDALRQQPNDSNNLCLQGWVSLEKKEVEEARAFFIDALRAKPDNQFAKEGLIECLKGRVGWYRWLLKWTVYLRKQPEALTGGIVAAGTMLARPLMDGSIKATGPLLPLLATIFTLLLVPLLIVPASNLLLRQEPEAAFLLDKESLRNAQVAFAMIILLLLGTITSWLFQL
ncbi:MAG: tetratricopeptide repeat protein [Phaeodactylibacter sp.]|nr:tetratricopeptide repeat protein [Phaeodactylibacter sp.]MCB9051930.1 tetratricopeptide repeat protein [Lewinellaceae bacterium]